METIQRILSQMSHVSKPQKKFLVSLFGTIFMLRGRMNFRNLSRYSEKHEMTFLRNFRKSFDFEQFNCLLIQETIPQGNRKVAVIDASYVQKSGKHSYGLDYFWSGTAQRCKKGQEISTLAVVDLDYNTAYTLSVRQTPAADEIGKGEANRIDFYLEQLEQNQEHLKTLGVSHIATDGFYTKHRFIDGIRTIGLHQIGRLREDANLRHLDTGPKKQGKGRPKIYAGKVQFNDLSLWERVGEIEPGVCLYTAVLNSPCFKRNLRVVYLLDQRNPKKQRYALFFSTDLNMDPLEIFRIYRSRFQIEFLFRDAKQFTGLTHCQARNQQALNFHFNASLAALNLLKKQDRHLDQDPNSKLCSIASWKARYFNDHLLDRFISFLDLDPILIKNNPHYDLLRHYGVINS